MVEQDSHRNLNRTYNYCKKDLDRKKLKVEDQYQIINNIQNELKYAEEENNRVIEDCKYQMDQRDMKCNYDKESTRIQYWERG